MHSFHIPVMGIGFTIDTPVKVAHYGISSVISLVDDLLMEKMREFYTTKFEIPFQEISNKIDDFRAKRITAYLNLVDKIVKEKFDELKHSVMRKGSEIEKYYDLLPETSLIKQKFNHFIEHNSLKDGVKWFTGEISRGSIDVNIMTKLDTENYRNGVKLPIEYNNSHAALRGFANSTLDTGVVLSAGLHPRLYSYIEQFDDFYPNGNGFLKKRIIIKVSDFKSASIQGKFLAKKGLWVSEYRIESGLNCGGHAFATQGHLMGPILEEFKTERNGLISESYELFAKALLEKNRPCPQKPPMVTITAQGGVGTAEEHEFLLDHYQLDSVGWGSPFLLVPEVTNVDEYTVGLLCSATEKDLYTSNVSPLGIPFNNIRGNTKDVEKQKYIDRGRPGSNCSKRFAEINSEFAGKAICTASRKYQSLKLEQLAGSISDTDVYEKEYTRITEKSCICVGLGTSALLVNNMNVKSEGPGVSVCPGPNMAYFSRLVTLREMVGHIYGKNDVISHTDRPNMFIKELGMYIDFLKSRINEADRPFTEQQHKYFEVFRNNLINGIEYYRRLFGQIKTKFAGVRDQLVHKLDAYHEELGMIDLSGK